MLTSEDIIAIRAIAVADRDGADGKAWDEVITPDTVISMCDYIQALKDCICHVSAELSAMREECRR